MNETITKKCPQCLADIPVEARRCQKCSARVGGFMNRHPIIAFLLFVFVVFPFIAGLATSVIIMLASR